MAICGTRTGFQCTLFCTESRKESCLGGLGIDRNAFFKHWKVGKTRRGFQSVMAAGNGDLESRAAQSVVIVGGGIAGFATGVALNKVGVPCILLEREGQLRQEGSAIGLWGNAWKALDALDVGNELRDTFPPCDRVELRNPPGKILSQFSLDECNGENKEMRGVLRSSLLETLAAKVPSDSVYYDVSVTGVDIQNPDSPKIITPRGNIPCKLVVGADGARSRVGGALGLSTPSYAGYSAIRGVTQFPSSFPLPKSTIFTLLGSGVRFGMYQVGEDLLYWFAAFNAPGDVKVVDPEEVKEEVLALSKDFSADIRAIVESTPSTSLSRSRLGDRWMLPGAQVGKGSVTVAGDALHPLTPNLGQGGCVALEDAVVLAQKLSRVGGLAASPEKISNALREFEFERLKRVMPLMLQSNFRGALLQLDAQPIVTARDWFVTNAFSPGSFLDPAQYDCGTL